jgi:glycosyltransferase involved in cell wall biosynthesis
MRAPALRSMADPGRLPGHVRILFATSHSYPPQRVGGAESSTHALCTALRGAVDDVAVLASLEPRGLLHARHRIVHRLAGRAATHDRQLGYRVYRAPRPETAVAEVVRRYRPDVAILHPDRAQAILGELLRVRQRTIVYLRDVDFSRLGTPLPADGTLPIIANSAFTAARAREAFGVDAPVIRPLIQPERYRTRVTGGEVLFVNPVPEKGVELALAIARLCPARRFRFIEGWPLGARRWASLEQAATDAGNITLQRAVLDMRPVYARATVVIVPSRCAEAWGRVVTEAQLNGIPVIASGVGGLPESVGNGGIVLDPTSAAETWASEIERLFTDPAHHAALSRRAFERSQSPELAPRAIVDELLRVAAEVAR